MSFEIPGFKYTGVCGSVTLAAKQYYFVSQDTDGTLIVPAGVTAKPIGILQNAPAIGQEAEVMVDGISKVVAGGAISIGATVGIYAGGKAKAIVPGTDTTQYILGIALEEATADGDIIAVLFSCKNIARAQ